MESLLVAISQYYRKHGKYPKIELAEWFYNSRGGSLRYYDISINNDVDVWDFPDATAVVDYCCGARCSEAGCCEW